MVTGIMPGLKISTITLLVFLFSAQGCVAATPVVQIEDGIIHFDQSEVRGVAISRGEQAYILAALSFNGIMSLSGNGQVIDRYDFEDPLSQITAIAVSGEIQLGSRKTLLVAMVDTPKFRVVLRALDPSTGRFLDAGLIAEDGIISVMPRTTHLCFARDRYDHSLYLFAGGDHGRLFQYKIFSGSTGQINASELQQVVIGGPTSACSSDDRSGRVYISEPDMGLWQVVSDPEDVPLRKPVTLNIPYGQLGKPQSVTGIMQGEEQVLLVVDTDLKKLLRLSVDGTIVTQQDFTEVFDRPVRGSIAGITTGKLPLNGQIQDVIAVAVTGRSGTGDVHLLPMAQSESIPAELTKAESPDAVVLTRAVTEPVSGGMDAADDPAIWVNPHSPANSLILGADKGAGLGVYDLTGKLLQFLPDGRINNVDVRSGFTDYQTLAHIAVASDRTNTALAIYAIDESTGRVSRVDARIVPAEFHDLYGLCMYRSSRTNELYAFATSGDGLMHQWRLFPVDGNKVDAELLRQINVGTVAEGCVVDDDTGYLYVAEETVGVWRYGAEPDAGNERTAVALIEPGGVLTADLEGLAIYKTADGGGYLVVTSQGSDNYSVYERRPPHKYRGTFRIRANAEAGLDGTSQTDGIDITHVSLPGYPRGLMVAQDGRYDESQNFKYVSWADIAEQLGLD